MAPTTFAATILVASCMVLSCFSVSLPIGHTADPRVINFITSPVNTRDAPEFHDYFNNLHPSVLSAESETSRIFLVHFDGPVSRSTLRDVQDAIGVKFVHYIPSNTYLMYCTRAAAAKASSLGLSHHIQWVGLMQPAQKRAPSVDRRADIDEGMYIRVALVDGVEAGTAKVSAKEWQKQFDATREFVTFSTASADIIMAHITALHKIDSVLDFLTAQPMVRLVEKRGRTRMNNAFAHGTLQSGDSESSPFWDAGIDGTGEVIGIGDSGLDWNRCAFADEKPPTVVTDPATKFKDDGHRKVKGYWAMMDADDLAGGHGTHVSGSVTGFYEGEPEIEAFSGGAKGARVLLTDIGCSTDPGCQCLTNEYCTARCDYQGDDKPRICKNSFMETYEPDDLYANFFPWSYANGARIHTNSWGEENDAQYRTSSRGIDRFVWENKDFLILYAAGNSGSDEGFYSVGSEAVAKNALTVGASQTTQEGWQKNVEYDDYTAIIASLQKFIKGNTDYPTPEDLKDTDTCCSVRTSLPALCDALKKAGKDCEMIVSRCCKSYISEFRSKNKAHFNSENLAYFSSLGFTRDGRIKPDVLSPGDKILSVNSHRTVDNVKCGTVDPSDEILGMSGTSMATPLLAGNAALVRQYFRDGYWPTGEKTAEHGFAPSSALMKAAIINSGRALTGLVEIKNQFGSQWKSLTGRDSIPSLWTPDLPSAIQGFGRVTLSNTLPLKDDSLALLLSTPIVTEDGKPAHEDVVLMDTDDSHQTCFEVVDDSLPVKITMVYTDYPGEPSAATNLVNDLDLSVFSNHRMLLGNHLYDFADNGDIKAVADRLNNVEQVTMAKPHAGLYSATVTARLLAMTEDQGQPFALVISGNVVASTTCPVYSPRPDDDDDDDEKPFNPIWIVVAVIGATVILAMVIAALFAVFVAVQARRTRSGHSPLASTDILETGSSSLLVSGISNE